VTQRGGPWLAGAGSAAVFVAAFFLRMHAAYGPFRLSVHSADWMVLWELWRQGQIDASIVGQALGLGAAAAAVPWVLFGVLGRRRRAG